MSMRRPDVNPLRTISVGSRMYWQTTEELSEDVPLIACVVLKLWPKSATIRVAAKTGDKWEPHIKRVPQSRLVARLEHFPEVDSQPLSNA